MRVEFESTPDDFVDVQMRIAARSTLFRSFCKRDTIVTALLTALLLVIIIPSSITGRLIAGAIGAIAAGVGLSVTYQWFYRLRVRRLVKATLKGPGPFKIGVEVSESGVTTKQIGTVVTFEWSNVDAIEETEDSIDFFTRDSLGMLGVRKRAFTSDKQKNEFLSQCRKHMSALKTSSG